MTERTTRTIAAFSAVAIQAVLFLVGTARQGTGAAAPVIQAPNICAYIIHWPLGQHPILRLDFACASRTMALRSLMDNCLPPN
jgi:hypothetical protein